MSGGEKQLNRIDMLNGGLFKKLLLFALPIAASSMLQQLFNAVDVAVVGLFADSKAQAAVGCNGPVINLIINLLVGISVGTNVVIALYVGQKEHKKIHSAVQTSMLMAVIGGIALLVIGLFVARPLLILMETPADVLEYAVLYLNIYFLGMPFIMVYNFGAAILRSIGDTKRPLYCLVISGLVNTGLNLFFVIVCHMGVAGVAIATVISNVISAAMVWLFLAREKWPVRLVIKELAISKKEFAHILRIGVPAGLQGMVFSVANVFIQAALNGYGSDAVAGSAVALNYEYFTYFILNAFSQAAVTFMSQNFGAQQYGRCKKIFSLCMIMSTVLTGAMSLGFLAAKPFFISLFTADSAVAAFAAVRMSRVLTLNFVAGSYEIGAAALRGVGYSMTPAVLTVFGTCVFRLLWVYLVCPIYPGFGTLLDVYPISWVITGAAVLAAYFIVGRKVYRTTEA